MNSKEYKLPNGKTAVFEYDVCGIGKVTLECMDELMSMIADRYEEDIVRCKECRYWKWIEWAKEYRCTLRNTAFNARADDFCSYGERSE